MSKPQQPRTPDPEHLERGDSRTVGAVAQADPTATKPADAPAPEPAGGQRPCQMMLSAPDEDPQSCGEPSVGGGPLYRYCARHLEQVARGGGAVYRDGWA